jgi:D-amino peptidase
MLTAAYFGVPYILHTGDAAAAAEARAVVPAIETATVKWGIARGSASGLDSRQNELFNGAAIHLHPTQARAVIRAAARRALERREEIAPFRLTAPYRLTSILRQTATEPPKTASVEADDMIELLRRPRRHS